MAHHTVPSDACTQPAGSDPGPPVSQTTTPPWEKVVVIYTSPSPLQWSPAVQRSPSSHDALAGLIRQPSCGSHVPVKHLSGGYQRRVNIGAAILHKPPLLILDEPTVGVDIAARDAVDRAARLMSFPRATVSVAGP